MVAISWCYFQLHIAHKTAKSMPTSPASRVVIYIQLAACPYMELFYNHPSTGGCLTGFRNKPQQKQPEQLSALIPA